MSLRRSPARPTARAEAPPSPDRNRSSGPLRPRWIVVAIAALLCTSLAYGQTVDDLTGQTVTIIVGSGPGGITDVSARIIGEYLERHLPGGPTVVVQNMPGGGSVTMANYVFRTAPRDGTVLGYPVPGMITAELLEPERVRYQGRRLNWIGSAFRSTNTLAVLDTVGVRSLDDLRQRPIYLGASGRGSPLYQIPALASALLGLDFEIVAGYEGGAAVALAMERGEVDGQTIALDFWENLRPDWLSSGRLVHLFRLGPPDSRLAPGVPHLRDLVASDRDRALVDFMEIGVALGWPLFAPPDVPSDRVATLRRAFDAVAADPAFADAVRRGLDLEPDAVSGVEVAHYVEQALSTPAPLVAEAIRLMGL